MTKIYYLLKIKGSVIFILQVRTIHLNEIKIFLFVLDINNFFKEIDIIIIAFNYQPKIFGIYLLLTHFDLIKKLCLAKIRKQILILIVVL